MPWSGCISSSPWCVCLLNLCVLGHLLALLQRHVRLFPIRTITCESSAAAEFPHQVGRADTLHFHFEQPLRGRLHHHLIGVQRHLEAQRTLVFFLRHALLSHHRPFDYFVDGHFASARSEEHTSELQSLRHL